MMIKREGLKGLNCILFRFIQNKPVEPGVQS